jgi:hypothetical protein
MINIGRALKLKIKSDTGQVDRCQRLAAAAGTGVGSRQDSCAPLTRQLTSFGFTDVD